MKILPFLSFALFLSTTHCKKNEFIFDNAIEDHSDTKDFVGSPVNPYKFARGLIESGFLADVAGSNNKLFKLVGAAYLTTDAFEELWEPYTPDTSAYHPIWRNMGFSLDADWKRLKKMPESWGTPLERESYLIIRNALTTVLNESLLMAGSFQENIHILCIKSEFLKDPKEGIQISNVPKRGKRLNIADVAPARAKWIDVQGGIVCPKDYNPLYVERNNLSEIHERRTSSAPQAPIHTYATWTWTQDLPFYFFTEIGTDPTNNKKVYRKVKLEEGPLNFTVITQKKDLNFSFVKAETTYEKGSQYDVRLKNDAADPSYQIIHTRGFPDSGLWQINEGRMAECGTSIGLTKLSNGLYNASEFHSLLRDPAQRGIVAASKCAHIAWRKKNLKTRAGEVDFSNLPGYSKWSDPRRFVDWLAFRKTATTFEGGMVKFIAAGTPDWAKNTICTVLMSHNAVLIASEKEAIYERGQCTN